jgi:Tfp pilus assembly protein PilX
VASSPVYVVEEIGNFLADGGSGIVSLDRGSASYGRKTGSGREIVLYRLQANGVGSTDAAQAVVESLYVKSL